MTGLLNPKLSETGHILEMVLVLYPGYEIFQPAYTSFDFSPNQFLGGALSSQIEENISEKK